MHLILPSTTSHKNEALLPTLDVFARLGFGDIDLNLNHMIERGVDPSEVAAALGANGLRVRIVSGGWCDFFADGDETIQSVERQLALARHFGVGRLRLFYGRLTREDYSVRVHDIAVRNIREIADRHPDIAFVFENHDGASSDPHVCRAVLQAVDRPNVGHCFDPINFEYRGVRTLDALAALQPHVAHVHLKGLAGREFCGFGEGEVDLMPALQRLLAGGYAGAFTVEYEGAGDRTVRLYESVSRAQAALDALSPVSVLPK